MELHENLLFMESPKFATKLATKLFSSFIISSGATVVAQ